MQECIAYFKARPVSEKLCLKVRDKYAGLGHLGGSVQLKNLSAEECSQLTGFFQKDFMGKKTITISYQAMEKALKNSRFADLKWEDILREYFGGELITKRDSRIGQIQRREKYFARILAEFPDNPGREWMERVLETHGDCYKLCIKQYQEMPKQFEQTLQQFLKAVSKLPFFINKPNQMLAVFAAETTGNPHFFDNGTVGEQLLTFFLKDRLQHTHKPQMNVHTAAAERVYPMEQKAELYYKAGLLKDNLSNNTLVYGIHAISKEGTIHEGIEGFWYRQEPVQLTLLTLGTLSKVSTQGDNRVYIVENPAVFSTLIQSFPDKTILCGNGQIRLATLVMLDLFGEDTVFYYAGDFDPEGLQIAQKLAKRYGDRLKLWNYRTDFYQTYQSDVELSPKRLKKLDGIDLPGLLELKQAMKLDKRAAYQEAMLKEYVTTLLTF